MMNEKVFQTIFDELSAFLPETWDKLVVYLEYGEDSYESFFYVKRDGKYVKCFDMEDISERELLGAFKKIDKAVLAERKKEAGDLWSNMTMTIDSTWKMHADFDYTDLSTGTYQYKKLWKKKYLV